jgi:hypothetical protein
MVIILVTFVSIIAALIFTFMWHSVEQEREFGAKGINIKIFDKIDALKRDRTDFPDEFNK